MNEHTRNLRAIFVLSDVIIFFLPRFRLAQKPRYGVLAGEDTITPCKMVKYHPSSNTLFSTEQLGGINWNIQSKNLK